MSIELKLVELLFFFGGIEKKLSDCTKWFRKLQSEPKKKTNTTIDCTMSKTVVIDQTCQQENHGFEVLFTIKDEKGVELGGETIPIKFKIDDWDRNGENVGRQINLFFSQKGYSGSVKVRVEHGDYRFGQNYTLVHLNGNYCKSLL